MRVEIDFLSPESMRYPTLGDWQWEGDTLHIRADETAEQPFLVALHELVEAWLCRQAGITEADVDAFDLAFVAPDDDPDAEPGDHPDAPYRIQHRQAMMVEMLTALFMGVTDYGVVR